MLVSHACNFICIYIQYIFVYIIVLMVTYIVTLLQYIARQLPSCVLNKLQEHVYIPYVENIWHRKIGEFVEYNTIRQCFTCQSSTPFIISCSYIYVIVVTWARGICLICMPEARGLRAYISGKSRAPMLQVLCITSGTLKITQTQSWLLCLFI